MGAGATTCHLSNWSGARIANEPRGRVRALDQQLAPAECRGRRRVARAWRFVCSPARPLAARGLASSWPVVVPAGRAGSRVARPAARFLTTAIISPVHLGPAHELGVRPLGPHHRDRRHRDLGFSTS